MQTEEKNSSETQHRQSAGKKRAKPKKSRRTPRKKSKRSVKLKLPKKAKPYIFLGVFLLVVFLIVGSIQWTSSSAQAPKNTRAAHKLTKAEKAKRAARQARKTGNDLTAGWQTALADYDGSAAIAVYSEKTGQTYTYTNADANRTYAMASTVKVSILTQLLHNRGGALSSYETTLAEKMIEISDNSAATALYHQIGSQTGLNNLYAALGMQNSHTASGGWGRTQTTPADETILLGNIFYGSNYLNDASRDTMQQFMSAVDDEQDWGISKGSSVYYLKNGWLAESKGWIVNSIGFIPSTQDNAKNSYSIAVYTDGNSDMEHGETIIEDLALTAKKVLQPKAVVNDTDAAQDDSQNKT